MAGLDGNVPLDLPDFQSIEEFVAYVSKVINEGDLFDEDIFQSTERAVNYIESQKAFRFMRMQKIFDTDQGAEGETTVTNYQDAGNTFIFVPATTGAVDLNIIPGSTIRITQNNRQELITTVTSILNAGPSFALFIQPPLQAAVDVGNKVEKLGQSYTVSLPAEAKELKLLELLDEDGITFLWNLEERELVDIAAMYKLMDPTTPFYYTFLQMITEETELTVTLIAGQPSGIKATVPIRKFQYALYPTPDKGYKVRATYYTKTLSFPRSGETKNYHWLLDQGKSALFAQTMVELDAIIGAQGRFTSTYGPIALGSIQSLIREDDDFNRSGSPGPYMRYEGN